VPLASLNTPGEDSFSLRAGWICIAF